MIVALITDAAAFTAGAGLTHSLWMTLAGWCLAVAGFSMDFYADRDLDSVPGSLPHAQVQGLPIS